MQMKECSQCGVPKSLEDFHNLSTSKDGKRSECRECRNKWRREARGSINKPESARKTVEKDAFHEGVTVNLQGLKGIVMMHPQIQGTKIVLWEQQTWSILDKELKKLAKIVG